MSLRVPATAQERAGEVQRVTAQPQLALDRTEELPPAAKARALAAPMLVLSWFQCWAVPAVAASKAAQASVVAVAVAQS